MSHPALKYKIVTMLCLLLSYSVFGQEKTDVEIHVGSKYDIYIDNSTTAKHASGGVLSVELTYGKHTVMATLPSYTKVTKTFTVTTDYRSQIVKLGTPKPIYGSIVVTSEPSNLEVVIDGKASGRYTPMQMDSVLIKSYVISLKTEGYYDYSQNVTVSENDTAKVAAQLKKKKEQKPVSTYTTTRSSSSSSLYSSGGTSSSSSYRSSSSTSSSNSSYSKTYREQEPETQESKNWNICYLGLGTGILLNLEFHTSLLDVRYKWIELRPMMWGINLPFLQNASHEKLPATIVNPDSKFEYTYWGTEYSMYRAERGIQVFYAPMIRFHIPLKSNMSIALGGGPQFSWTKYTWKHKNGTLDSEKNYVFSTIVPPDNTGLLKDNIWFTAEFAWVVNLGWGSDMSAYARYQDGFYIGFEYRFGRKY